MPSPLTEKLRAFATKQLAGEADPNARPAVRRLRELASTVNDLLGRPLRTGTAVDAAAASAAAGAAPAALALQVPVLVYFDGKDHRTKTKIEVLLQAHDIVFQILDVADDEAERSWIVGAAKTEEFPIVVVGGTPVGGLAELTQLDVTGELKKRVFPRP